MRCIPGAASLRDILQAGHLALKVIAYQLFDPTASAVILPAGGVWIGGAGVW